MQSSRVEIIKGGFFTDERGSLHFVNDFGFSNVKRFYQITHNNTSIVRAWQGHKIEHKYFYTVKGVFLIAWVPIDDWDNPSSSLIVKHEILASENPSILSIPAGYANGIKALSKGSILTVYSNLNLEQSEKDRWSFDSSLWLDWSKF